MKNKLFLTLTVFSAFFLCNILNINGQTTDSFTEIKGKVVDSKTNTPLIFTNLVINDSNISTISNTDGKFVLKIPQKFSENTVTVSYLGYEKKEIKISSLKNKKNVIELTPATTELNKIEISALPISAKDLVIKTLNNKSNAYNNNNILMTAFYRETIKKRRKNASLSEAVVKIHKQPYSNMKRDYIELIKSRKNTNYNKLDTLALKLQGGPFSNIYTDIVKYPEYIFTKKNIELYNFSFDASTNINKKLVYVVNFKQKNNITDPMYYGKLYIDAKTKALTNAIYHLNVENKELSSQMFVRKKPRKVDVYPTEAIYKVNYRTKNGKWHYAYSNISLTFKVNWKGKLFNNIYTLNSEMAITDWETNNDEFTKTKENILKPTTILADETSGFSDPEFWGKYNIIEPEKSIETAIKKIQKQLKRT